MMHSRRDKYEIIWTYMVVTLIAIAALAVIGAAIIQQTKQQPQIETANLRQFYLGGPAQPPGSWRFDPKPDITPYELALSIQAMFGTGYFIDKVGPMIEAMPPEARRHWIAPVPEGK